MSADADLLLRLTRAAARSDGLLTLTQLQAHGAPRGLVRWRCRDGGPWLRVLPRVVALAPGALTPRQCRRAALLQAGPGGALTAAAALHAWRVRRAPTTPRVAVRLPHDRRVSSVGLLEVHRRRQLAAALPLEGLDTVRLPEAVVDLGLSWPVPDDVLAVVCEVVQRGRVRPAELRTLLDAAPRRHSAVLRRAVLAVEAGVWSVAEDRYRQLVRRSRTVPEPRWNRLLLDASGAVLGRPDGWLPDAGVVVQVQSEQHHLLLPDWERTMDTTTRLAAAGLLVVQVRPRAVTADPAGVLRTLEQAYRAGRLRGPVRGVREAPSSAPRHR